MYKGVQLLGNHRMGTGMYCKYHNKGFVGMGYKGNIDFEVHKVFGSKAVDNKAAEAPV
jgi:hypothetical protein